MESPYSNLNPRSSLRDRGLMLRLAPLYLTWLILPVALSSLPTHPHPRNARLRLTRASSILHFDGLVTIEFLFKSYFLIFLHFRFSNPSRTKFINFSFSFNPILHNLYFESFTYIERFSWLHFRIN